MEHFYTEIQGWLSTPQMDLYKRTIELSNDGSHFVEIGTWKGKSASLMAVEIANSGKNIKFDTIDTFKGSEEHQNTVEITNNLLYEICLENLESVKDYVNIIVGDSAHCMQNYANESLDFIFIDGDHSYEGAKRDILACLPKLKPGGIIAGDDFDMNEFPGVTLAVTEILGNIKLAGRVWMFKVPKIVEYDITVLSDDHLELYNNLSTEVDTAYVITILGNETSEECAKNCVDSLQKVDMNYIIWPAFDGTDRVRVKTPETLKGQEWLKLIRIMDHLISPPELACMLSHISLWVHCIAINKPIVILEHDAVMLKKYTHIPSRCCIEHLGHCYWAMEYMTSFGIPTFADLAEHLKTNSATLIGQYPILNMTNENYFYQMGHHAYAIDPFAARKMLTKVISEGITATNDAMTNINDFTLYGRELFATQSDTSFTKSTIKPELLTHEQEQKKVWSQRKPTALIPGVSRKVKNELTMNHPAWKQ